MKSIYGLATAPLAFHNLCVDVFTKVGLQWLRTDECVFLKYVWNIKGKDSHLKALSADLDVLSSLADAPEGNRVYPSCPHSIGMLIVVQYVDNSGIRYNCREVVDEFYPSCPYSIGMLIVVQYVDNSGIRYNCRELVDEFDVAVR